MTRKLLLLLVSFVTISSLVAQSNKPLTDQDYANMQQLIDANGYHWIAGRTTTSDLSFEEKQKLLGFNPPKDYDAWLAGQPKFVADPKGPVMPAVFDWRDSSIMTPVKNQAGCGSCWAFGATGAFEALVKKHDGIEYDLAEQQALSCNIYGSTCAGGWIEPVYELYKRNGAIYESCMPYMASDTVTCKQELCAVAVKLKGWINVNDDVLSIKQALLQGPLATGFLVYDDFFSYTTGCYQHTWGELAGGHIVVIVGWDNNACGTGEGAWLCKNSWGPGWGGLGGYFWIKWGDSNIGNGTVLPTYPPDPVVLAYEGHQISDGTGDNDGIPDENESFLLPVTLRNSGLTTATDVQAILRSSTVGLTITDSTADYPSIPFNQVATSVAPHFAVTLGSELKRGTRIDFTLDVFSTQGNATQSFYTYVGHLDTLFFDDMESGSAKWTHGGTLDDWQCDKPYGVGKSDAKYPHSGSNIWGNNLSGEYAANAYNYLESKTINCSGLSGGKLRFYRWLASEKGIYDQARVLVNGTQVWVNNPDYDHIDWRWAYQDIDIAGLVDGNPSVKIRFELQSDVGLQLGGWNIDDIAIAGILSYFAGDADADWAVDISDAVYLIAFIFSGGPAPVPSAAGDANCDGAVDISDAVYLISFIFSGGQAPGCK